MSEASKTLSEQLFYTKKTVYEAAPEVVCDAMAFAGPYMQFLDAGKTERECVTVSIALAEEAGFTPYRFGDALKPGRSPLLQ